MIVVRVVGLTTKDGPPHIALQIGRVGVPIQGQKLALSLRLTWALTIKLSGAARAPAYHSSADRRPIDRLVRRQAQVSHSFALSRSSKSVNTMGL